VFSDYNFIKIGDLHEKVLENYNIIHKNNEKYVLFSYKNHLIVPFHLFLLRLPTSNLFVFHIIDSFSYLLENIILLNKRNICFFDLSTKSIAFNNAYKPILRNFSKSIQLNHIDVDYLTNIIEGTDDYTLKPLEIHVLFYLINGDENTLSYSSIETICESFVKNNDILKLFSLQYREKYYESCVHCLKKYINNHKNDIITDIMKYSSTWDNYSLSSLYLYLVGNFNKIFCLKDCFLSKFCVLLNKNLHSDPLKRETLKTTQEEFHKLMNYYTDWSFVNDLSAEKFSSFLERITH
jgi:hypothetical protein